MSKDKDLIEDSFEFESFQQDTGYTLEELINTLQKAKEGGEKKGWTDVKLCINSRVEPYEDWAGDAELRVVGKRLKTQKEKQQDKKGAEILELARQKGISYYEARQLKMLMDRGVV